MSPGAARCWSSLTRPSAACNGCCPLTAGGASHGATTARCWAGSCGSCTPAGRGVMSPAGSGLADLPWPAAALAAGWDLAEGVGAAGRWRRAGLRRRSRWPARPGAAGGGASGSVGRGLDGGAATTTTPAPAAPSAVSTTPARPAADAPARSRPGPGPILEVVALLRGQPPPLPARAVGAAWARTAARNAWATSTRVTCRYQPSQRRTW